MTRQLRSTLALVLIAITAVTGCTPTQPFYFHEDGDLSHYLDQATELEHPDVYRPQLEEVQHAKAPLTLSDPEFAEIWDLTLEECVSIAVQNSKVFRNNGVLIRGSGIQVGGDATAVNLTGSFLGPITIYEHALQETATDSAGGNNTGQAEGLASVLADFDPLFQLQGTQGGSGLGAPGIATSTDRINNTANTNQFNNTSQGGLEASITKRTATGLQLRAESQTDRIRGNSFFPQTHNSFWEQTFQIDAVQPLLRGRGTMVNRVPVILARINGDLRLTEFEGNVCSMVSAVENAYWDLHCAYRQLETAKIGRDSAQVTWNNVYEKKNAGVENAQAEAQAREQYFFFRAELELALRDLQTFENQLRFLMGLAATDGRLIRPSDEPTAARVRFDWHQIHEEMLFRSFAVRNLKWRLKSAETNLLLAKNQLLPQLDVGAFYRWYGAGDNLINADRNGLNFPEDGSTAFDVLTEGRFQEAGLTFSLQMPVGFRKEMSAVRNANLDVTRLKALLEDLELNESHLLSQSYRDLDFFYTRAQTQFNRWKASQAEVESVDALYRGGKTTLDLVLDAQRRRAQAQIDYYRALCDYNQAISAVHYRKGSLLEYNNIYLAEGPWPEKAYWDAHGRARERDASYYLNYGWTRPGVVSQGPVAQHIGDLPLEGHIPAGTESSDELIPTPQPTPAETESGDDEPQEPGPITNRPDGPELNAPRRADAGGSGLKVATRPADAYDWGSLGLEVPASEVQPASFEE